MRFEVLRGIVKSVNLIAFLRIEAQTVPASTGRTRAGNDIVRDDPVCSQCCFNKGAVCVGWPDQRGKVNGATARRTDYRQSCGENHRTIGTVSADGNGKGLTLRVENKHALTRQQCLRGICPMVPVEDVFRELLRGVLKLTESGTGWNGFE